MSFFSPYFRQRSNQLGFPCLATFFSVMSVYRRRYRVAFFLPASPLRQPPRLLSTLTFLMHRLNSNLGIRSGALGTFPVTYKSPDGDVFALRFVSPHLSHFPQSPSSQPRTPSPSFFSPRIAAPSSRDLMPASLSLELPSPALRTSFFSYMSSLPAFPRRISPPAGQTVFLFSYGLRMR